MESNIGTHKQKKTDTPVPTQVEKHTNETKENKTKQKKKNNQHPAVCSSASHTTAKQQSKMIS